MTALFVTCISASFSEARCTGPASTGQSSCARREMFLGDYRRVEGSRCTGQSGAPNRENDYLTQDLFV